MRGIFTDGNMTINDSTVTASGTKNEGMVAIKGLRVNNSKLTASCSPGGSYIWAIVTGMLEVTASEITAYGGIDISDYYTPQQRQRFLPYYARRRHAGGAEGGCREP